MLIPCRSHEFSFCPPNIGNSCFSLGNTLFFIILSAVLTAWPKRRATISYQLPAEPDFLTFPG